MARTMSLIILMMIALSPTAIAEPLWTRDGVFRECRSTNKYSTDPKDISSCVNTTYEYFLNSAEHYMSTMNKSIPAVSKVIEDCKARNVGEIRLLGSCIGYGLGELYHFVGRADLPYSPPSGEKRELTADEQRLVEQYVRSGLKDEESARFRHSIFNGSSIYCGEVNAKNSYGGYTGYEQFALSVSVSSGRLTGIRLAKFKDDAATPCRRLAN